MSTADTFNVLLFLATGFLLLLFVLRMVAIGTRRLLKGEVYFLRLWAATIIVLGVITASMRFSGQ